MAELYCDICGRTPVRAQILLEGAKLLACGSCMRSGKILHRLDDLENSAPIQLPTSRAPSSLDSAEEVVEGAGAMIRSAREKLRLPPAVVAERINEKESYLHLIENGRIEPSLEIARKLEKELDLRLIERHVAEVTATVPGKSGFAAPTLADMLTFEKKKKEK